MRVVYRNFKKIFTPAALSDIGRNLPSVRKILELRKNATIYCQKKDENSNSNILEVVALGVEFLIKHICSLNLDFVPFKAPGKLIGKRI